MRPHELRMTAFGPFAQETRVNFDAMGDNVFLIAGDTGSGKTTIFDAIVYALYGTASGSGRSALKTEAFHSDYAKHEGKKDDMKVELDFSEGGRRFTVTRSLCWGKTGRAATALKEAALTEGGRLLAVARGAEEKNEVTAKIVALTGMDAGQFRRIVMLAQGEFQRFLQAKSDEREAILGKIYDNGRHRDLQTRLKAAKDTLKGKIDASAAETKAQLGLLVVPGDTPEEERAALREDHPERCVAVARMLERQEAACGELGKAVERLAEQERESSEALTEGKNNNGLLDKLDKASGDLTAAENDSGRMDDLRRRTGRAEAAERVLPLETARRNAEKALADTKALIKALEAKQSGLQSSQKRLETEKAETDRRCDEEIGRLQGSRNELNRILEFYTALENSRQTRSDCQTAFTKAEAEDTDARKHRDSLEEKTQKLKTRLAALEGAGDAAAENARHQKEEQELRCGDLTALRAAIARVLALTEEESRLKQQAEEAENNAINAETTHLDLLKAQREGRAGLLARELRYRLEREESAPCPVCGTVHTRSDIPRFAQERESIPNDEEVKAALDTRNALEKRAAQAKTAYEKKRQEREIKQDAAVATARVRLALEDWDAIRDGKAVSQAIEEADKALDDAKEAYTKACGDRDEKNRKTQELAALTPQLTAAQNRAQEAQTALSTANSNLQNANRAVTEWEGKLAGFPSSRKAADAEIDRLSRNIEAQEDEKKKASDSLNNAKLTLEKNEGQLAQAKQNHRTQEQALKDAEEGFGDALARQSFGSEEAYRQALRPEGLALNGAALERWIGESRKKLNAYDEKLNTLKGSIQQLKESTAGLSRVDVAGMENALKSLRSELEQKRSEEGAARRGMETNQKVHKELVELAKTKARLEKAMGRLQPLSDIANSRTPFSRYVLEDFFNSVIEQANVHLDTMTNGEYQLVRGESEDGRKHQGLGVRVLNAFTNQERDTASLSGGQSFEASLALALGLSDVVQRESGNTIRIDSMFIDEGFGSLDASRLDSAVEVLKHLSSWNRQIGIISHVPQLEECLQKKLRVIAGPHGSKVKVETDEG